MADTSNTADVIDSRDIIARIEELEEEAVDGIPLEEDRTELASLRKLAEQAEGYASDWKYGEALIRDSHFETYAQELAEECHELPAHWPFRCIDWEQAARELQQDYTAVDYDGVTYWIR